MGSHDPDYVRWYREVLKDLGFARQPPPLWMRQHTHEVARRIREKRDAERA